MSWSFNCIGKPAAILKQADTQRSSWSKCAEPEETIRNQVFESLKISLSAMPASTAVQVEASGSQYSVTGEDDKPYFINSLNFQIKPIYGFVE